MERLPFITKESADEHIAKVDTAVKNGTIDDLILNFVRALRRDQPSFVGEYLGFLAQNEVYAPSALVKRMLGGYNYGFSDIFYLFNTAQKPLPPLSDKKMLPLFPEILNREGRAISEEELLRVIDRENPNLMYYYEKKFGEDLKSNNTLTRVNAVFFSEGFFDCYLLLRKSIQRESQD